MKTKKTKPRGKMPAKLLKTLDRWLSMRACDEMHRAALKFASQFRTLDAALTAAIEYRPHRWMNRGYFIDWLARTLMSELRCLALYRRARKEVGAAPNFSFSFSPKELNRYRRLNRAWNTRLTRAHMTHLRDAVGPKLKRALKRMAA